VRAGGSGSRGTRRLQPAVPGLNRLCRSTNTEGHPAASAGQARRASQTSRTEGAAQAMRQPGHGGQVSAPAPFTEASRAASCGTGTSAVRPVAEAGLPGERADQFPASRWRDRSDCGGGVHQASKIPAVRAVTTIPADRRHPRASPQSWASDAPHLQRLAVEPHRRVPTWRATYYEMAVSIRSRFFLDD